MKIMFFEDPFYNNFEPISFSRPVYMLLCGTSRIYQKWLNQFPANDYGFLARPFLTEILALETGRTVNDIADKDFVLLNGRLLPSPELASQIGDLKAGQAFVSDDLLLAYRGDSETDASLKESVHNIHTTEGHEKIKSLSKVRQVKAEYLDYIWNLVDINSRLVTEEFSRFQNRPGANDPKSGGTPIINRQQVYISESVEIAPSVVIDATDGPVIIEEKTKIEPFSFIQGPCYIGPDCRIVGGRIRSGTSLGPVCRVGGEVEESIMIGYCNKYHEGFLGHAYLGEWVNLGALTTNSDLKNNYKEISVEIGGKSVNSGSIKVGSFIGDHTKTGIGTMLNTGINIGFSCNLYGAGLFAHKSIPSFSWGTPINLANYKVDKAIETAAISMKRRGIEFTKAHEKLFNQIRNHTESK